MTREEAIKDLEVIKDFFEENSGAIPLSIEYAIKALVEQELIFDKIKAEILEEKECAYADFERYKVEYLGQDQEDVLDSLPQDEFRYGMERCVDIIDKYKAEREDKDGKDNN